MGGVSAPVGGAGPTQIGGAATATSGDAKGASATGSRVFNFGANPNSGLAGSSLSTVFSARNVAIAAVVVGIYLWRSGGKKRRR